MHSVAVLNAVCRRWRTSWLLIDAQVASISCASQALIGQAVIAPDRCDTRPGCEAVGKTLCAASCTVRLRPSLLTPHWSSVERRQQVSTCQAACSSHHVAIVEGGTSTAVLDHSSEATGKYPTACILA